MVLKKSPVLTLVFTLFSLALVGLMTVKDYGISWDEWIEIKMVQANLELVSQGKAIQDDWEYYGQTFNFSAEALYRLQKTIQKFPEYNPLADRSLEGKEISLSDAFLNRIKVKHIYNFLFSFLAYIGVAGIVGSLVGFQYAWVGPLVLAFFPRFWGHSFFNPKDIPFAAAFTISTWLGACLINLYLQTNDKQHYQKKKIIFSLLYGVLVGLATGTRIGSFFLLFFLPFVHLILIINSKLKLKDYWLQIRAGVPFYLLLGFAWALTTSLIHPAAWSNPPYWFFKTLKYLAHHAWRGEVLFDGQLFSSTKLPWFYLLRWWQIIIPVVFQIAFLGGIILLLWCYRRLTIMQRAALLLTLLQIFTLPGIAILKKSVLYDAERQFLFVLPGIAAIASVALILGYQRLKGKWSRVGALTFLIVLLIPIFMDMVAIHPYQYAYFNRAAGGLSKTYQKYEQEYWGLSLKEGMEWLNQNAPPNSIIAVGGPEHSAFAYANPSFISSKKSGENKPNYYLSVYRGKKPNAFAECSIVHQVTRQSIPFAVIKKCQ